MATLEACIRKELKDGFAPVYIRISQKSKTAYIKTHLNVEKRGVDGNKIKDKRIINEAAIIIKDYYDRLNKVDTKNWDVKQVIGYLIGDGEISFTDFFRQKKNEMINAGRDSSAESYQLAYSSLSKEIGKDEFNFSDIKSKVLRKWIKSLSHTSRAKNLYPTLMKAVFEEGLLEYNDYDEDIIRIKGNPFIPVEIPSSDLTHKKAISIETIKKLFTADVSNCIKTSKTPLSQDVAIMSFCLAAMNTADLYDIKKDQYKDEYLLYNRKKTRDTRRDKAYIEIKVPKVLNPYFKKYEGSGEHLFSFAEMYSTAKTFNLSVNKGLKELCKLAKVDPVDTYTFRHSWATIAQNDCGASKDLIGLAMNHASSNRVTAGYISEDFKRIDELNEKVIKKIFGKSKNDPADPHEPDPAGSSSPVSPK